MYWPIQEEALIDYESLKAFDAFSTGMDMSELQQEDVGYIKYSGEAVPHGVIDAAGAGTALTGLDEAIRFFNERQVPGLARLEYDVPVKTEAGSWVAYVLSGFGIVGSAFMLSYAKKAGEKMAENDFKDIGLGDVFKKSMRALRSLAQLIKHTGKARDWELTELSWRNNAKDVGVPNDSGEYLYLPAEFLQWYASLPPRLIGKLVVGVRKGRVLSIGVRGEVGYDVTTIDETDKPLFDETLEAVEEEFLFPELEHGSHVKLEGRLIRGNEASNSVGLEYQGHILNCHPEYGNVRQYKRALFLRCVVEGTVTRLTKNRYVADKRPTILISKVAPLEGDDQYDLF